MAGTYTDAQKRADKKYRETHRDKVREYNRIYQSSRYLGRQDYFINKALKRYHSDSVLLSLKKNFIIPVI